MSTKLYVGNLPFTTTEAELREVFEPHGELQSVNVITDRETGRSRGFAFVEYEDGSSGRYELRLVKAKPGEKQRFEDIKGKDAYVIDSKGNLDLWDDEGFIRECKPAGK